MVEDSLLSRAAVARYFKFGLAGGLAFVIDAGLYYILTRHGHLPYLLARTISITTSMIWNFLVNRYWTFQAAAGLIHRQAVRFTVVVTLTSLANLGLMKIGVSVLHLPDLAVLVTVSLLLMVVNYFAHRLWSYRV